MNALGYQYLRNGKLSEAIEIFKLNVTVYPEAANTYDSLGEAYMINGNKELAIKNYTRSLELNPDNTNAMKKLKKLTEQ
jgi:tetratricopeptide (TPR) repeat protein